MRLERLSVGALLFLAWSPAALAESAAAQLARVSGQVWTQKPGAAEESARAGGSLVPGTRIRTGEASEAEVQFGDGSLLKMQPRTSLVLSGHPRHTQPKTSVVLFFGRVWSKVTRAIGSETKYEVASANAVCGVRGTEFETAVADDGSVRVRVTSGKVGVDGEGREEDVDGGEEVSADEQGVGAAGAKAPDAKWEAWQKQRRERLRTGAGGIVDKIKAKVMSRKGKLEVLRAREQEIESKRKQAEERARGGDRSALDEIRAYNQELAGIADEMADLGDEAASQFGLVDHFADLAGDPRFKMVDRKYLEAEAQSLRRVKATLDKLVADGTDISMKAMDDLLREMGTGKPGNLKDQKGSSKDDLFGPDNEMDKPLKP